MASSAESELTQKDLAAIEGIVQKETAKTEKYTDLKFKNAETEFRTRFDGLDKQLVTGFSNVDKRLGDFRAWTIGVIVKPSTVLFFVGLWIVKAIKQLSWTEAPHHRITNAPRTSRTYSTAGYDGDFR